MAPVNASFPARAQAFLPRLHVQLSGAQTVPERKPKVLLIASSSPR
jgi:hypothetical protein